MKTAVGQRYTSDDALKL